MSTTSEDTSSSDYSTDSSDEDGMETAQACGTKIQLPQGLCERKDIFEEFFTVDLWNSFSDEEKEHLQTFLPNFPENDDLEKTKTLQRLFDFENFRFCNPLNKFYEQLKAGYLRPDIARMRRIIRKTEVKEGKYRQHSFREQLKNEVIESQQKLLSQIKTLPPGVEPKQEKRKISIEYVSHRTKKRYFQILGAIKGKTDDTDFSSDENYPEGPSPSLSRKQKRHLNSIRNNVNNSKETMFGSTMVAKLNGFSIDLEKYITSHHNPFYINDESYKNMLNQHKRRRVEKPEDSELDVDEISVTDIINRTQLPFIKNLQNKSPQSEVRTSLKKRSKKESGQRKSSETPLSNNKASTPIFANHSSYSDSDSDSIIDAVTVPNVIVGPNSISKEVKINKVGNPTTKPPVSPVKIKEEIKSEPLDIEEPSENSINGLNIVPNLQAIKESMSPINTIMPSSYGKITPIKMEDLDTIDIMNTPIELDNTDIDIMELSVKPELMQETHANFFSLIRDVICSTNDHRMNMYTLQERLKAWQENPISPLNDWYSYVDNWINILPSAITFLCGNASEQPDDFVPYMEYKPTLDVYQWIGAGRDSDPLLSNLCTFWLQHRTESKFMKPTEIELDIADRDSTPPPPRCPTTWTVRKATSEEIKEYREQERKRYDNPHKAFTFRCNGYESVVGPLKGMYNPASASTKARGHNMLNADRPNFVTILSLVRDATARLPNGEGTRSDICELLKSSQYICSTAPDNILQSVVSGALDRMHTQWDPCVKYDQKRKIWIYLHRHRTEDDFERIHQHYQGVQKIKKNARKSPAKPKTQKTEKQTKSSKQQNQKVITSAVASSSATLATSNITAQSSSESPSQIQIEQETLLNNVKEEIIEIDYVQESTEPLIQQLPTSTSDIITVASSTQKPTTMRRQSLLQSKIVTNSEEKSVVVSTPSLISTGQKSTSLLLSNNPPKQEPSSHSSPNNSPTASPLKSQSLIKQSSKKDPLDQESSEMIHIRTTSPIGVLKGAAKGSMVKIVSPSQGKSLIIPTSNPQILKQIQERPSKSQVSQQYLQSLTIQPKQKTVTTKATLELLNSEPMKQIEKTKIPVSIQQQMVQGITSQQLQSIKNVTLLRTNNATGTGNAGSSAESQPNLQNVVTVAVPKGATQSESVQIKTSSNLTPAQTQQILQTIKQKYLPNANVLTPQQQVLLKQKSGVVQLQKSGNVTRNNPDNVGKAMSSSQGPVVAKVLTNAAGQVISVESLLAHQKAHGSLPQGTTLRVQGSKAGQQNIIHLTSTTKPNAIAHFTVGTQNSLVALTTQPKLVVTSQTTAATTVTSSKSLSTRTVTTPRTQQISKTSSNVTQHLINAKIITSDGQKIVQPKVMVGGQTIKVPTKSGGRMANLGNNSLRMLNTANLNLTTIDGKPVLLASKSGTIHNLHGQNVIVQAHQTSTSSSLVLQSPLTKKSGSSMNQPQGSSNVNVLNQSGNILFSPTGIKNQLPQQVLFSSQSKNVSLSSSVSTQSHIVLGSQPIRLQTSNATGSQRVVLASQGQGGQILAQQILLPAGFQGTAINIKSLQGVKVIPIAQNQGKGQGRQIFAKVMSPSVVKQSSQTSSVKLQETLTIHSSESE